MIGLAGSVGGTFLDDFAAPGSDSAAATELLEQCFPEATGGSAVAVLAAGEGERLDSSHADVVATLYRLAAGWTRRVRGRAGAGAGADGLRSS